MDKRVTLIAAGAAAALGLYLYRQGTLPSLTADERAWGDVSYSPYVHWLHQSPGAYIRHFPESVGQNCLPQVIQNQSLGLAVPMVEVDSASYPSSSLLTRQAGPLPVWGWMAALGGGVFAYSRYKASKAAAAASTTGATGTGAAGEPATGQPEYLIENNLPSYAAPSAPVAPPLAAPPVVTPPGTGPLPPINVTPAPPVIQGGHPPVGTGPVSVTPSPTAPAPVPKPPTAAAPAKKAPVQYKVISGDTLSSIAARYKTTAAALYTYNTTPGVRPASTIATLKQRGPNLIYPGETILIPQ